MLGMIGDDLFRFGLAAAAVCLAAYLCFWLISLAVGKKLKAALEEEYGKKRH